MLILDRVPAPARLRGKRGRLRHGAARRPLHAEETTAVERTVTSRAAHPIVRGVRLEGTRIGEAVTGSLDPRATVVAAAGNTPLLYTYRTDTLSLVASTFALTELGPRAPRGFPCSCTISSSGSLRSLRPAMSGTRGRERRGALRASRRGDRHRRSGRDTATVHAALESVRVRADHSGGLLRGPRRVVREPVRRLAREQRRVRSPTASLRLCHGVPRRNRPRRPGYGRSGNWIALAALLLLVADWAVWARRHG